MTKAFFSKIILIVLLCYSPLSQAIDPPPSKNQVLGVYVDNLMTQFLAVAKDQSLSENKKTEKVRTMLKTNLDFDWMGKFVLGKHRRSLKGPEVAGFIEVYKHYLIKTYSETVKKYDGQNVQIRSVQKLSGNDYVVKTAIVKPNQDPLLVDYLVRKFGTEAKPSYKVFDMVTEGVSLINSQQSEFTSILGSSSLSNLQETLKQKTVDPK